MFCGATSPRLDGMAITSAGSHVTATSGLLVGSESVDPGHQGGSGALWTGVGSATAVAASETKPNATEVISALITRPESLRYSAIEMRSGTEFCREHVALPRMLRVSPE